MVQFTPSTNNHRLVTNLPAQVFARRFRLLIALTWIIPPVFGFSFLRYIKLLTTKQVWIILTTPIQPLFVLASLLLAVWYFDRYIKPVKSFLTGQSVDLDLALKRINRLPRHFWGAFILYLLIAPSTVIFGLEIYSNYIAKPIDWFRIHLVALNTSIIVGLPIFFLIYDLLGQAFHSRLDKPYLTIKTKVFLISALVPLLIDTMLVQYYWTRTGFFTFETFLVWFLLEILAIGGSLIFVRSFNQSLSPLQRLVIGKEIQPDIIKDYSSMTPQSIDELGVLSGHYQGLLEQLYLHGEILEIGNRILRSGGTSTSVAEAFDRIVEICKSTLKSDAGVLILYDDSRQELVGVAQTGEQYNPAGHFRIPLDETALTVLVFQEGHAIAIEDVEHDPRVSPRIVRAFNARSAIAAPLITEHKVIGVLMSINQGVKRSYSQRDLTLLEGLAREAAIVVHTQTLQHQRQLAEERFRKVDELARVTLQSIGDGVITTNIHGHVEFLNPVAEELTGWPNFQAQGKPLAQILKLVEESTGTQISDPVHRCLQTGHSISLSGYLLLFNRQDEKEFSVEVRVSPIKDTNNIVKGVVLIFHDVTQLRLLAHRLSYQATHDPLTGLINRREFETRLELALARTLQKRIAHTLCFIDIDQFKVVNDTCGHIAGDELLKQIASRLRTMIRESDNIGRLGGDEFGLLFEDCPLKKANKIATDILSMANNFHFKWQEKVFNISMSIGMVPLNTNSGNITDVLSAADSACYVAKELGRNRIHIFEQSDIALAQRQGEMQCLQLVRKALDENRFVLYFQPIKPLSEHQNGQNGEILLRMLDEENNIVQPGFFLPIAERYHLMPSIDRWVVRNTLTILQKKLKIHKEQPGRYSINLSAQSLSDDHFLDYVVTLIKEFDINPNSLCFEITETTAIADLPRAMVFISTLKGMGCRFSLDDFGSGLSSFGYLKNLPVDYIKIDGSFVKDMVENPIDRAMVEAINQIGHLMDMETVAEFVTNEATQEILRKLGVDYAQGYYIAKPGPLNDR